MEMTDDPLNQAFLLYMLDRAAPIHGRTKLQKTPFFVELALCRQNLAGPTFHYKRYKGGPYCQEVWNTADLLVSKGFLHYTEYGGPTERGLFLLDLVEMLRSGNEDAFGVMDEALKYCRGRSGKQLMDAAYEVELEPVGMAPGTRIKVRDVPQEVILLAPSEVTLQVPSDLQKIIEAELATTPAEIEEAKARFPEYEREGLERLIRAIPEGPPS